MKKYLLSSLLIIMISLVSAKSHFLDMRVGDFGCITRVVFEFTGKIDYKVTEDGNKLSVTLNLLKDGNIQLPIEESNNINNIELSESLGTANLALEFTYPVEVTSYNYFQESKNYVIVLDVYDKAYQTDKLKGLATLLFKAQKFQISKISSDIDIFSEKYSSDPIVNMYLGRLYATKKMKTKAMEYFKKIDSTTEQFFTAQAYIDNLNKNRFPTEEVKPDFLEKIELEEMEEINDSTNVVEQKVLKEEEQSDESLQEQEAPETESGSDTTDNSDFSKFWYFYLAVSLLIIIIQLIQSIKKKYVIKELSGKLENSNFELNALENKLAKGVVENSKTKDKIIIKLYNSGWKPADIANELSTSLEVIEATISKEGRL